MSNVGTDLLDCIEIAEGAIASLLADYEALAWKALCEGFDDLAESINRELIAARAEFNEFVA